jgi:hypothetical protein
MRLAIGITLLLSALSSAQSDDHALMLLRSIDSSARTTKSWRAEGIEVSQITGNGMNLRQAADTRFTGA